MEQADLGGIRIEYEGSGTGEPVVLIHGAFIADAFRPLLVEASMAHFRLIPYRRRGYAGSSHASGPIRVTEQAEDCRALMRRLGLERAHVVGHSFGGAVALQLALDAPDLVRSLVLLEPALAIGSSGMAYRESLARAIERYRGGTAQEVIHDFLEARWPGYREPLERLIPGAFGQAVSDAPTTFESELPGLLDWSFTDEDAAKISQPVLSVMGGGSAALSPRFGEVHAWLLDNLSRTEGHILPNAHHFMQIENAPDTANLLADFFARNPIRPVRG